jgi:aspartyl-tRNA(Asn)/glutamyl-tRNA(Gln) amidotransferase subunit B
MGQDEGNAVRVRHAYEVIIGMEVHAQVVALSKMFCACSADYAAAAPNTHTCPVCLGMPGVLPVINRQAMEATVLTGLALQCTIPPFSKWDRKNYPYPDLPKGYQISQYDYPLAINGWLEIEPSRGSRRVGIRRVHLEEDTAKLVHEGGNSLIDFNRAGIPLMEIVTEADIRSAEEAWLYLVKLRSILRYLGVNSGNMEEGAMRCEANISLRLAGTEAFGTKVEVKNLNSFRAVRMAIDYEIDRQTRILEQGERVEQVTMGWDDRANRTVFQRSKEYAADYRYFPEPDLPPLEFRPEWIAEMRDRLPELPDAKRERLVAQYAIKPEDARVLAEDRPVAAYFEATAHAASGAILPQVVANWLLGDLFRLLRDRDIDIAQAPVTPERLAGLLVLVGRGSINATVGKGVLAEMFATGESAEAITQRRGLCQINDEGALSDIVHQVLQSNPRPVQQYLEGKEQVVGFLVGQVMRATGGQANVQVVKRLLVSELSKLNVQ